MKIDFEEEQKQSEKVVNCIEEILTLLNNKQTSKRNRELLFSFMQTLITKKVNNEKISYTNFDKIKTYSVDEMVKFLNDYRCSKCIHGDTHYNCFDEGCEAGIKDWLLQDRFELKNREWVTKRFEGVQ